MSLRPGCYIRSHVAIGISVPEKIFIEVLPYMGVTAILVMEQLSCYQILISMFRKAYIQNLVTNDQVVSEKIKLKDFLSISV